MSAQVLDMPTPRRRKPVAGDPIDQYTKVMKVSPRDLARLAAIAGWRGSSVAEVAHEILGPALDRLMQEFAKEISGEPRRH